MPTVPPQPPRNPTLVARASVQALCTMDAVSRTVNVTGRAHDALSRRKLVAQHDALQAADRPNLARVMRGAVVARVWVQPVTAGIDYLVGTGKTSPKTPSIRASWALVRRGNTPQAHAARLEQVGQQAMDDASHPARMGVYGDAVSSEFRIRTRLAAPMGSAVGMAVGTLSWCLTRPFHRPTHSLREAGASGAVWGASAGAGVAALSMLLASPTLWAVQVLRTVSAAVKGAANLVGLAGGALDLGAACLWGAGVGAAQWAGTWLWNSCLGGTEVVGPDETYAVGRSASSASDDAGSVSETYFDCYDELFSDHDAPPAAA